MLAGMESRLAMTIDVEDWFHAENLARVVPRSAWGRAESRVERNTHAVLDHLAVHRRCATFFVLGLVAERFPGLVRRIVDDGHELASHGYGHQRLTILSRDAILQDVLRAKHLLEDLGGVPVYGYRAPCFSITDQALAILHETGHRYDSSYHPVRGHNRYGRLSSHAPDAPVAEVRPGFYEVRLPTFRALGADWPWAGGGYFRLLPERIYRAGVRRLVEAGSPFVFYLHPWEIDPGQPRPAGMRWSHRFRHRVNLARTAARWDRLLEAYKWDRLDRAMLPAQRQETMELARVA